MSESAVVVQPPYLALAQAARNQDVQDIAEMSAMRVASMLIPLGGAGIGPEYLNPMPPEIMAARLSMAVRIVRRQMPRDLLAIALVQAPDVAMAIAMNQNDPAGSLATVDLAAAWARNWTDYALLNTEG